MSKTLRIGLAQFDIAWEDRESNFRKLENLVNEDVKTDLIILPEMWSTGFSMRPESVAENEAGTALSWMITNSKRLNTAIAGSVSVADGRKYYNRFYFVHPEGHVDQYDKKHLFSYGKENDHYQSGLERITIDYMGWKIMPIICYDLRFPVWCRNNVDYDLMIVVANWPSARVHHWDALIRARAIENQSYIAAVNRIGVDGNGLQYPGHSCIIDMNGNTVMELGEREVLGIFTLEKDLLTEYRQHFRFLQDQDAFEL